MKMKRREFVFGAAATAALWPTAGCATLLELLDGALQRPKIKILNMKILDTSLEKVKTQFNAQITNPNPFGLSLAGLKYAIDVDGREMVEGNAQYKIQLKAIGSSKTLFPVNFAFANTAKTLLSLLQKNTVDYKLNSSFSFQIPQLNRTVAVPVSFGGNLPVPSLPKISVSSFDFTKVSARGIGVKILTSVTNNNAFSIPVDNLSFNVKLNQRSVLQNRAVNGLRVASGKTQSVPLEFSVNPLDIGLSALEILQRPQIKWGVDADLKSGLLKLPFAKSGALRLS